MHQTRSKKPPPGGFIALDMGPRKPRKPRAKKTPDLPAVDFEPIPDQVASQNILSGDSPVVPASPTVTPEAPNISPAKFMPPATSPTATPTATATAVPSEAPNVSPAKLTPPATSPTAMPNELTVPATTELPATSQPTLFVTPSTPIISSPLATVTALDPSNTHTTPTEIIDKTGGSSTPARVIDNGPTPVSFATPSADSYNGPTSPTSSFFDSDGTFIPGSSCGSSRSNKKGSPRTPLSPTASLFVPSTGTSSTYYTATSGLSATASPFLTPPGGLSATVPSITTPPSGLSATAPAFIPAGSSRVISSPSDITSSGSSSRVSNLAPIQSIEAEYPVAPQSFVAPSISVVPSSSPALSSSPPEATSTSTLAAPIAPPVVLSFSHSTAVNNAMFNTGSPPARATSVTTNKLDTANWSRTSNASRSRTTRNICDLTPRHTFPPPQTAHRPATTMTAHPNPRYIPRVIKKPEPAPTRLTRKGYYSSSDNDGDGDTEITSTSLSRNGLESSGPRVSDGNGDAEAASTRLPQGYMYPSVADGDLTPTATPDASAVSPNFIMESIEPATSNTGSAPFSDPISIDPATIDDEDIPSYPVLDAEGRRLDTSPSPEVRPQKTFYLEYMKKWVEEHEAELQEGNPPPVSEQALRPISSNPIQRKTHRKGLRSQRARSGSADAPLPPRRYPTRKSILDRGRVTLFELATLIPGLVKKKPEEPKAALAADSSDETQAPSTTADSVSFTEALDDPFVDHNSEDSNISVTGKRKQASQEDQQPAVLSDESPDKRTAPDVQQTSENLDASVTGKRKRASPDRIPNPPGCSYGMYDEYFEYDDEDFLPPAPKKVCVPPDEISRKAQKFLPKTPSRLRVARRQSSAGKSSSPKVRQVAQKSPRKTEHSLGLALGHEMFRQKLREGALLLEKEKLLQEEARAREFHAAERAACEWLGVVCPSGDLRSMEWPVSVPVEPMDPNMVSGGNTAAEHWAHMFAVVSGGLPRA